MWGIFTVFLVGFAVSFSTKVEASCSGKNNQHHQAAEIEVLRIINEYRQSINKTQPKNMPKLSMLKLCNTIGAAAQNHSNDMRDQKYYAHIGKNGSEFWERTCDTGYEPGCESLICQNDPSLPCGPSTAMGEIITGWASTAQSAFSMWKNSGGHDALMKHPAYRVAGVGHACGGPLGHYWTINFAASESSCNGISNPGGGGSGPTPPKEKLDFGNINVGSPQVKAYIYTNDTNSKVKFESLIWSVTSTEYDPGDFRVDEHKNDCFAEKIQPGETCPVYVTFNPKRSGKRSIIMELTLSNGDQYNFLEVKGNGVDSGGIPTPTPTPTPEPTPDPGDGNTTPDPDPEEPQDYSLDIEVESKFGEFLKGTKAVIDVRPLIDGVPADGQFIWLTVEKPDKPKPMGKRKKSKTNNKFQSTAQFKQMLNKPGIYKFTAHLKSSMKKNSKTLATSETITIEVCKDKKGRNYCP